MIRFDDTARSCHARHISTGGKLRVASFRHAILSGGLYALDASPLCRTDPIALEALPDGSVLILDRLDGETFSEIVHYRERAQMRRAAFDASDVGISYKHSAFELVGYDFCFVPEHAHRVERNRGLGQ